MNFQTVEVSASDRFKLWYEEPFEALKAMKNGNGAIVALMMALPLYERVYSFELAAKVIPDNRPLWVKEDLGLPTEEKAKIFWNVFRDGLCHMGSFAEISDRATKENWVLPKIGLDAGYPDLPQFTTDEKGDEVIVVNPWGFVAHVLSKYKGNVALLEYAPAPLLSLKFLVSAPADLKEASGE